MVSVRTHYHNFCVLYRFSMCSMYESFRHNLSSTLIVVGRRDANRKVLHTLSDIWWQELDKEVPEVPPDRVDYFHSWSRCLNLEHICYSVSHPLRTIQGLFHSLIWVRSHHHTTTVKFFEMLSLIIHSQINNEVCGMGTTVKCRHER